MRSSLRHSSLCWCQEHMLTLGCCCSLTAYWAGASPQTLFKWYTLKAVFLYGARFYLYR